MVKRKLWIPLLILLCCLLAAVLTIQIIYMVRQSKQQPEPIQTYYDQKCAAYAVQNTNLAKGQIVFIGDSITDLYILDNHYADLPLACYNRGIGGDTTHGVLQRLQVSLFDISPSVVVLMIGTNDINGGDSPEAILQRYGQILEQIYANLPDVTLYCMSVIPQNTDIETYSTIRIADTTPKILSVNTGIRALAADKGAVYLDLFSLLADENDHLIREYSDDGLHLNVAGLTVWTQLLKPYLT